MKYLILAGLLCPLSVLAQDHGHLNVGSSGDKLTFDNGADFGGTYVKTLVFTDTGKYANLYNGNITLTALHSTNAFGEIDPAAPKPGAFIAGELVSVSGPAGGEFAFWDSNTTTAPSVNVPVGTTNAAFRFEISESGLGAGQPGGDPFGHIHGRRFTASKPGLYTVGFRAYDLSTNGPAGGPLHSPADLQLIKFQAGVVVTDVILEENRSFVSFGALAGYSWEIQATDSLRNPDWKPIGPAILGSDSIQAIEDSAPPAQRRYYRVMGTAVEP